MTSPEQLPDEEAQTLPPFTDADATADGTHGNENQNGQSQELDIVRQDGDDDQVLACTPPPSGSITPEGIEVFRPGVRQIPPSSDPRMARSPPGTVRNPYYTFRSDSFPGLGAIQEENVSDIHPDHVISRTGKASGRDIPEPAKNSRFFGDPGGLHKLERSVTDLSSRIQELESTFSEWRQDRSIQHSIQGLAIKVKELENRCCEGHSNRTTASANVLQEEFIRQITAIFEDHNQGFTAFQDNLEATVTRAGNSLMDCAEQQIQAVQDSAAQAIQSLVNNGGCPCLSKPGEYTQPSLTSEILAQPQGSTSKSASPGHSKGSHGQSGGERRNDIYEADEAFDGAVPDQRFEERGFNQRLQRNRINNMSEVAAWDEATLRVSYERRLRELGIREEEFDEYPTPQDWSSVRPVRQDELLPGNADNSNLGPDQSSQEQPVINNNDLYEEPQPETVNTEAHPNVPRVQDYAHVERLLDEANANNDPRETRSNMHYLRKIDFDVPGTMDWDLSAAQTAQERQMRAEGVPEDEIERTLGLDYSSCLPLSDPAAWLDPEPKGELANGDTQESKYEQSEETRTLDTEAPSSRTDASPPQAPTSWPENFFASARSRLPSWPFGGAQAPAQFTHDDERERVEESANRPENDDANNVSSSTTDEEVKHEEKDEEIPLEDRNSGVYCKYGKKAAVYDKMSASSRRKAKKRYKEQMKAKMERAEKKEKEHHRE
jgi:hypothetical protein